LQGELCIATGLPGGSKSLISLIPFLHAHHSMASQTDGFHGSTEFGLGLSLLYHLSVALSNAKDLDAITETYSGSEPLMLAWAQASKTKTALGDKLEKLGLKLLKDLMKKPGDPTLKVLIGQCEQMGSPALKQLAFVCKTLNHPPAILDGTLAAEGPALASAFKAYVFSRLTLIISSTWVGQELLPRLRHLWRNLSSNCQHLQRACQRRPQN
jgi:hypothetical protein